MTDEMKMSAEAAGDDKYDRFLASIGARFLDATTKGRPLFTTPSKDLFPLFLDSLAPERRAENTCSACRHFVERFGGLVTINDAGRTKSALWGADAPPVFQAATRALEASVESAKISGVFLSSRAAWGEPKTLTTKSSGGSRVWHHMSVVPKKGAYAPGFVLSAGQEMARLREDFAILLRGLAEFSLKAAKQARALLATGSLYRSEKCLGVAEWLLALHNARSSAKSDLARENITWTAVAKAPPGFCHIKSTMIGTLLEDIQSGMAFDDVKRRFDAKLHPLQYQRPTALPSAGNVGQAEKLMEKLGIGPSLVRRFARLEDLEATWTPASARVRKERKVGVFANVATRDKHGKRAPQLEVPPITMTWAKFARDVLPGAEAIELRVPTGRAAFTALVTAKDASAPPILQWDTEDERNAVSSFVYHGGTEASRWNLHAGTYQAVTAVTLLPAMWGMKKKSPHHGEGVIFILQGARDTQYSKGGGFFPESLRSELHGVRKTIEAYVTHAVILGNHEATACGLSMTKGGTWNTEVRVASLGIQQRYVLDRWD